MKRAQLFAAILATFAIVACDPLASDEPPVSQSLGSGGNGGENGGGDSGGGNGNGGADPGPSCPGGFRFAISGSDSSSSVQSGDLRDGIFPLYLWKLSGTGISALQADVVVEGGLFFPGSFSAEPPFLGVNLSDGPDLMVAVGGCPCEELLVGSFYVDAGADGVRVSLTPGNGGGAVNCATNPQLVGFQCVAYSSR